MKKRAFAATFVVLAVAVGFMRLGAPRGTESAWSDDRGALRVRPPAPRPASRVRADTRALRMELTRARAAVDPERAPIVEASSIALPSSGGASVRVDSAGGHVTVDGHRIDLTARSIGRDGRGHALRSPSPRRDRHAVVVARDAETSEWWRALPSGIEHGFTLERAPVGHGEVTITMTLDSALVPSVEGRSVVFRAESGDIVARYDSLLVVDADDRELAARFELDAHSLRIRFDDHDARYPVVVDPTFFAEGVTLMSTPHAANDGLGATLSMTLDGTRVVTSGQGEVVVFLRTGASWAQEARLVPSGLWLASSGGNAVAISGDGTRLVVGSPTSVDPTGMTAQVTGALVVFTRGASWIYEATVGASDTWRLGGSVAMNHDGTRIVAGDRDATDATNSIAGVGSARVFVRSASTWSHEQTLYGSDIVANMHFGAAVAISSDGSRVAIGAPTLMLMSSVPGATYVVVRTGSVWAHEQRLLASDRQNGDSFGSALAITPDATRLVVGAPATNGGTGGAYVFSRSVGVWSQESKLLATGGASGDSIASSVAIDQGGSRVLLGAPDDDDVTGMTTTDNGNAHAFVRAGATWAYERSLLPASKTSFEHIGSAVAIDGSGFLVAVGARWYDDPGNGSLANTGGVTIWNGGAIGAPCSLGSECASGSCVDSVCCTGSCGGGAATDCMACSNALTGVASGTCAALSVAVAASVTCRASTGACDPAEVCSTSSTSCPANAFASSATVCRAPVGSCDIAESCTGSSGPCPNDVVIVADVQCRASTAFCDVAERCDGLVGTCPGDAFAPSSTVCRASAGACDLAESCTGSSTVCPGDTRQSDGIVCNPSNGSCDPAERCDGVSVACPADAPASAGVECRASIGPCDLAESCNGITATCPLNGTLPDGTACDDGLACTQTSACALGSCAPALTLDCSDGNPCTIDTCSEPSGCAHSPVATCGDAGPRDGGTDGHVSDGGESTITGEGGCSCRVGGRSSSPVSVIVGLVGLVFLARSREGRRRRAHA